MYKIVSFYMQVYEKKFLAPPQSQKRSYDLAYPSLQNNS